MSPSVLYMSMSLDGYIAGPNDEPSNPGDGFDRLHEWFGFAPDGESVQPSGPAGQLIAEINATGAVLSGRRTAEQVDHWGGDHHGVPIFVQRGASALDQWLQGQGVRNIQNVNARLTAARPWFEKWTTAPSGKG